MYASAALHPVADIRCFPCQGAPLHNLHAVNRQPLQLHHQFAPCQHRNPWFDQQHWWERCYFGTQSCSAPLQSLLHEGQNRPFRPCVYCSLCCRSFRLCSHETPAAVGGVSVNVPQFFVPPADSMSQVSVMDLRSAEVAGSVSDPCETRRTVSLPKMSRESLLAADWNDAIFLHIILEPV